MREVAALLRPLGYDIVQVRTPYPEVQADTLDEVVRAAIDWLEPREDVPFILEDSGLFIQALNDFPGVYSSYVFRTLACDGILRLMHGMEERAARFECCVGLLSRRGKAVLNGAVEGVIAREPRGGGGFGFDPIFIPRGRAETFAEISLETKNSISHRGRAFSALADHLKGLR